MKCYHCKLLIVFERVNIFDNIKLEVFDFFKYLFQLRTSLDLRTKRGHFLLSQEYCQYIFYISRCNSRSEGTLEETATETFQFHGIIRDLEF